MSQTLTTTSSPYGAYNPSASEAFELRRLGSGSEDRSPPGLSPAKREAQGEQHQVIGSTSLVDDGVPPPNASAEAERWNRPRRNIGKLGFAFLSFIIAGMNDGVVGALIPYFEEYYKIDYTIVSIIFLTPFLGYSVAAFTNARIHVSFGQRGVAVMAPLCHLVTYAVLASHPPYPALVAVYSISGFGNGLTDACFCAWVGAMDKANTIQGFLHSCYSLGALFAPIIATSMVVSSGLPWYTYYYLMIGLSCIELAGLSLFFWRDNAESYKAGHARESGSETSGAGTREALKSKVTWLCALFFFSYMGVEVGLGGWVVTFMLRVRKASHYASGVSGSGFWAGMALGRASLGFVTERYGERLCLTIYLAFCVALELLFWLVPQFIVSAVAVAFLGFFLGPLFPGAVMVTAKLLPKRIHVSAIGFAMAMGGTGGTVFPFAIGAIAATKGVEVLQPIVLALIVLVGGVWLSFPRIQKRE